MSKSSTTTQQPPSTATKRGEPLQQLHVKRKDANTLLYWVQLSFELDTPTAEELWRERRSK